VTAPHIDPQVIIDKLAGLGSADDVARFFRVEGVVGDHSLGSCPVARYIGRESGQRITVTHTHWGAISIEARLLPRPVADFVMRFDGLDYPDLIGYPDQGRGPVAS
jgi:hypothetical protein